MSCWSVKLNGPDGYDMTDFYPDITLSMIEIDQWIDSIEQQYNITLFCIYMVPHVTIYFEGAVTNPAMYNAINHSIEELVHCTIE